MTIQASNQQYALDITRRRDRQRYGYGGVWVPDNIYRTTDCSGIVTHQLDAHVNGPGMRWSRHGLSTEAYRYVGGPGSRGPFGTIRVARPGDIPADAAVKIGLMHGPGGGANSHMACTVAGIAIESRGGSAPNGGQIVGRNARGFADPLFRDWFYLPGPVSGGILPPQPPAPAQPPTVLFLSIGSRGDRVTDLQRRLNRDYPLYSQLEIDGDYGPATADVVMEFQRRAGLVVDGVAGPATLRQLGLAVER